MCSFNMNGKPSEKKLFSITFSFFLLISFCCSSQNDANNHQKNMKKEVQYIKNSDNGVWNNTKIMKLEQIIAIGIAEGDSNYLLVQPIAVTVDDDENIYVCDKGDNKIKVYSKDGQFLKSIGRKGGGPGELIHPYLLGLTNNDQLVVIDNQRRANFYSLNAKFLSSFNIKEGRPYSIFCDKKQKKIYLTFLIFPFVSDADQYSKMIFSYNLSGKNISSFGKLFLMGKASSGRQYSSAYVSGDVSNKLFLVFENLYRIEIYNSDEKLESVIERDANFFPKPELVELSVPVKMLLTRSEIKAINFFPDGKFLLTIFDKGEAFAADYKNYSRNPNAIPDQFKVHYDLFDSEGHFLQSFLANFKEFGVIAHIDFKGYVYTVSSPDQIPVVRKYQLSFVNKK